MKEKGKISNGSTEHGGGAPLFSLEFASGVLDSPPLVKPPVLRLNSGAKLAGKIFYNSIRRLGQN